MRVCSVSVDLDPLHCYYGIHGLGEPPAALADVVLHRALPRFAEMFAKRGISATFWRSLRAVGDRSTFQVMGTPFCGKGEPNQVIRVGHAAPACLFADVDVFGGESG